MKPSTLEHDSIDKYYNDTIDVIHLKFGDARKMYFFTNEFIEKHPNFCKEFAKFFEGNPKSKFKDALEVVNYVEMWNIPVTFYFNYTDTPAKNIKEIKDWIMREHVPRDMGTFKDGKMFGWDGEKENESAT